MHPVELLAVVPAGLEIVVRGAVAELRAERIVVHALHDIARVADAALDHLADVAEMVTVVIVEDEVVLAVVVRVSFRLAVALVELEPVDAPVPQREPATEKVVHRVSAQYLRRGELPGAADGDADVRNRSLVHDAQLLARGAVYVFRYVAVGELDAHGVVPRVVAYPRYPAPGVAHERASAVVGEGVLLPRHPVEVRGARV